MKNSVLLIGNGINNINNKENWADLLKSMTKTCKVENKVEINNNKPFPLLYEEIYLKSTHIPELILKKHIAKEVQNIEENEIHELIREKRFKDIITTNYEYTLQGKLPTLENDIKNLGRIKETKYSIFRHNKINDTRVWHIHGECKVPDSITLGYEHYGGQLQQMRNYVVSGTHYKKKQNQNSLSSRLKSKEIFSESCLELFFTRNIHIVGLALDFVESDIWWLLTYRARLKKIRENKISNKIFYYIPQKYCPTSKNKIELLKAVNVNIIKNEKEGIPYYTEVINYIHQKR